MRRLFILVMLISLFLVVFVQPAFAATSRYGCVITDPNSSSIPTLPGGYKIYVPMTAAEKSPALYSHSLQY